MVGIRFKIGILVSGLGLLGGLRKPTLTVPSSNVNTPTKSFGSDGKLLKLINFLFSISYKE